LDGGAFVEELREQRERSGLVDGLQRENLQLRAELDSALGQLKVKNEDHAARNQSPSVQTTPEFAGNGDEARYERLVDKHNSVVKNYQELVLARDKLEDKLRSSQSSRREWVEYANGLEKKIGRLEKKLTSHGIALKSNFEGSSALNIPPAVPSSSRELVPARTTNASLENLRRELPNLLHMSERISELARNASLCPPQPTSINRSEQRLIDSESSDTPLPQLENIPRNHIDLNASVRQVSRASLKLLMDTAVIPQHELARPVPSEFHDSGTTEEDTNVLANMINCEQIGISPVIKAEPLSDTPIIISSRSVKKRKNRSGTGSNDSGSYAKVKVEILTSSPIGLAGLQNLFPQESMDLDEIGEKMNTPKKRRQAIQASHYKNDSTTYKRLPAESVQAIGLQRGGSKAQTKGSLSALQPTSPNKQILPRTSGKEREPKRRRLEERMRGAVIFGEDGENDVTSKIGSETEIQTENPLKLPANAAELQRRLSDLLEEPSSEKEVLTPTRPLAFSTATAQLRARATPVGKYEIPTPLTRHQVGAGAMPNTLAASRDVPQSEHKPSTAKKRTARTPKDIGAFNADGPSKEPLRARPVHLLGLEHFKVNPSFNQGSDYAFTDVVRGRELRKCLPGCTKPECCGDKFRKFIEFTRAHEQQTFSQEEENVRLLEDYLGDNKGRLRSMTQREKEELLIQAKARELANKASKHRHAYERRRSPPGFWRSDFPSTQELLSDRQEAANRERELVQERYEEAMRPGGRWLFRDE
jgi:hypothetical protein